MNERMENLLINLQNGYQLRLVEDNGEFGDDVTDAVREHLEQLQTKEMQERALATITP